MADAITSAVALAVEEFAACIQRLPFASSIPDARVVKVKEDIKRLSRTLARIQARLIDAEEMEIRGEFSRLWLRELEEVAYAAEGVLDEFRYVALRLIRFMGDGAIGFSTPAGGNMEQFDGAPVLQVRQSVSSTRSHPFFAVLNDIERKIEAIFARFDEIARDRIALQFEESYGQRLAETPLRRQQPTSSLMTETHVFGRENDLEKIKELLLLDQGSSSRNNSVPAVIAIVGMGGLGKTTLARLAYNDAAINRHFDLVSWVSVSEIFDLVRLTRAMVESFNQEACHITELDPLQVKLQRRLAGQRFLLVLDDVWEVENLCNHWDSLIAPLCMGSAGSRVVITARTDRVSRMTGASSTYHLPCLQDGHCLELFSQRAFRARDPRLHPKLLSIGRRISKRCRGLPLIAKTLGDLLRCEDDEQIWRGILEGDILEIVGKGITPARRRLNYQRLPRRFNRYFRYPSVSPISYPFDRDQHHRLVQMWYGSKCNEAPSSSPSSVDGVMVSPLPTMKDQAVEPALDPENTKSLTYEKQLGDSDKQCEGEFVGSFHIPMLRPNIHDLSSQTDLS